jgi:hypothetical protein
VRINERYLAFYPAVPQAFLVHSGEVRPKVVGHKKVNLETALSLQAMVTETLAGFMTDCRDSIWFLPKGEVRGAGDEKSGFKKSA